MARRDLSKIKLKVRTHDAQLKRLGLSFRTRRNLLSTYDGLHLSLDTLGRWEKERGNRTLGLKESDSELGWKCPKCKTGDLHIDRQDGLICKSCKAVVASTLKQTVLRHNRTLKRYNIPIEKRIEWINGFNHVRVSLRTLEAWENKDEQRNRTAPSKESDTLNWKCKEQGCSGELVIRDNELCCSQCALVYEQIQSRKIALQTQIEQNQPALESSFGHGLGTPTPESLLRFVVKQATLGKPEPPALKRTKKGSKHKLQKSKEYQEYGRVLELRAHVNGKDVDRRLNVILEFLTRRTRQIFGFDPTSDHDAQFGDLNDLGRFLRKVRAELNGYRFSGKKTVDALLFVIYGEKAREIIERPEKHLQCPRCRRERPYVNDSTPNYILCMKCGKQIHIDQARFKVTYTPLDPVYLATIKRLMPPLPISIPQSDRPPQVIGQPVIAQSPVEVLAQ
jgi:ribosomal protein L37AE/L43A